MYARTQAFTHIWQRKHKQQIKKRKIHFLQSCEYAHALHTNTEGGKLRGRQTSNTINRKNCMDGDRQRQSAWLEISHPADMSFLKSIFGEVTADQLSQDMPAPTTTSKPKTRRISQMRDDGGGNRERFRMTFPDETEIDPYNPQTFG